MGHVREHVFRVEGGAPEFLWHHASASAERALGRLGGPLRLSNLERFLRDRQCLRYTTSIQFDDEGLGPDQFAEPVMFEEGDECHCCLRIHPKFQHYPEAVPYLVAYMAAAITYGASADAALCGHLGSMLVREPKEAFHARIGRLAHLA